MSLNENKPKYGAIEAPTTTKGSRRGVVAGLAAAACFFGQCERQHGLLQGL